MFTSALSVSLFMTAGQTLPAQTDAEKAELQTTLGQLHKAVVDLRQGSHSYQLIADIAVYEKGVDWCLRHNEFHPSKKAGATSAWVKYCQTALETGLARADELNAGKMSWTEQVGSTIRAYVSAVDGSVQPYALSLPANIADVERTHRWPLHVKLHGRGGTRNEVRFFAEHSGKAPQKEQDWIQLDVFGRTDNAYRWSGETDVFEALADVKRRFRIDDRRITLWGFSMGGAGAWHLGLHHPSKWSSVGPGAGFVDFYKYQKQTGQRPPHEHKALRIYDSIDYSLNLFDVPFCTYGGELDAQLVASTSMVDRAKELNVPVKLLVGPGMGHKFHPDSFKEFMGFHLAKAREGRPKYPGRKLIRFVTHTLKYNLCDWMAIEEVGEQYAAATVEGGVFPNGVLRLRTSNVTAVRINRDRAYYIELDGKRLELAIAADGLLPDVYFVKEPDGWRSLGYDESREFVRNPGLHKRHNLQGPIDDAFMEPFVCVRGTGTPWSTENAAWSDWTLARFEREFDKWLRGYVPVINDDELTDEDIANNHIVLFGDPGSNSVLKRIVGALPVKWSEEAIVVNGESYSPKTHGLSLVFPNPLNPNRYVVVNSGHTMHEKDFRASNSWLFPRLGDIAMQKFERKDDGSFDETVEWAELFDGRWKLPVP